MSTLPDDQATDGVIADATTTDALTDNATEKVAGETSDGTVSEKETGLPDLNSPATTGSEADAVPEIKTVSLDEGATGAAIPENSSAPTDKALPPLEAAAGTAALTEVGKAAELPAADANGLPSLDSTANDADKPVTKPEEQSTSPSAQTPPPAIEAAPSQPATSTTTQIGNGVSVVGEANLLDAVKKKGLLVEDKLLLVETEVSKNGKSLELALIEAGGLSEEDLYRTKAEMFNIEFVDLSSLTIDESLFQKVPLNLARQYMAVPVEETAQGLKVAMSDPLDIQKTRFIGASVGGTIIPVFSTPAMINFIIDNKYGAQVGSEVEEALEDVGDTSNELGQVISTITDLESGGLAGAPVSKIVNMMLEYAIRYKSSDIHIEPREKMIGVRFRIFGVLVEKLTLPKKLLPSIVSRIKILANLKIDEHRVPQDGRFQVKMGSHAVDLRVSIIPTVYGEKTVMRLLEKGGGTMGLPEAGMRGHVLKLYTDALSKTQGIILVTGPTGSGKTQTLASSLKIINKPDVNIITLEDPVEIRVDGVNQVQVNADVGLTFAKGLRSFLRQDPDIVMIGEIRDAETAELAVQAALTGHLVLSTLHTNSAAGAIPRMIDMGIEPFLLSSTIEVVVAQRLVRKICDFCKEAYYAPIDVVTQIHKIMDGIKTYDMFKLPNNNAGDVKIPDDDKLTLYRGKGCAKCNNTGYNGRLGIFEALDVNENISKLILQKASTMDIAKTAVANGMVTMAQDGFMKALEGITTIEEVLRAQYD